MTAPTLVPSTNTSATAKPELGVIANVWLLPLVTTTLPDGLMEPPDPALAVIVAVPPDAANAALIVWFACTLLKV